MWSVKCIINYKQGRAELGISCVECAVWSLERNYSVKWQLWSRSVRCGV